MLSSPEISQIERTPPCDMDAERSALSSLFLADTVTFFETRALLSREMFYQEDHRLIFDAITSLFQAGKPRDAITVRAELERRNQLAEVGGSAYLGECLNRMPSAANGPQYAAIVRERAILRGMLKTANWLRDQAFGELAGDESVIDRLQIGLQKLSRLVGYGASSDYTTIADVMEDVIKQTGDGGARTITTGFRDLDRHTGGVAEGEMCIIGARPSMGKSTILKQIALNVATRGTPVAIISLEESRMKIGRNLLSGVAGIDNHKIRNAQFDQSEFNAMEMGAAKISALPIFIADKSRKLADIRAVVGVLVARYGVKMVIVDYLQRVQASGKDKYEQASNASTGLSDLFKDLEVAGIVAAQLNRQVENREIKEPNMSDLRESGQIEQDADGIIFLHRPDYYGVSQPGYIKTHDAKLVVAKWRDGERGAVITLKSNLRFQRFEDDDRTPFDHQSQED